MPPLRVISSLMEACCEWVWRWLHYCLDLQAAPPHRLHQRTYILANLNSNIRQKLVNRILGQHMHEVTMDSKCLLLQLLADGSTHQIDLTHGGYAFIEEIFHLYRTLNLSLLTNLTHLGLICNVKMKNDYKYLPDVNSIFYRLLNQMHHLQWVRLSGVADRTILATLGANCHFLEHLDVSGSVKVDDEALAALLLKDPLAMKGWSKEQVVAQHLPTNPCCTTLNFICVSETSVSELSTILLLRYVANLTSLGGFVEAGYVCGVIELLQPNEGVACYKLNQLWEVKLLPRQASLLKVACPNMMALTTTEASLPALNLLHPLMSLAVDLDFHGSAAGIYSCLQTRGDTLKELRFLNSMNCPLDLAWLMELTPNLEWIECHLYLEEGYEIPIWRVLRVAAVIVNSSKVLLALLTHTPNLRHLTITFLPEPYRETFECINDDLLTNVILAGGLTHLQKLSIKECAISLRGVHCLLLHSLQLTYIAALFFWKNISQDDIQKLQLQATQNNWQLSIVSYERTIVT